MAKPLGILGGTFDPVHFGHLRLALEVRQQLGLEQVRLTPLYKPPHRDAPVANAEQRLRMLQLATQDTDGLVIDDCELGRAGTSYTIDTVRLLRDNYPQQSLCLIIGADQFQKLDSWREWARLTDYVHIIVVDRPGLNTGLAAPALTEFYNDRLVVETSTVSNTSAGAILKISAPLLDISSTRIRSLVHSRNSIKYLLPDAVIHYIEKQNLYQ